VATAVRARVPGRARLGAALALAQLVAVLLAGALVGAAPVPTLAVAGVALAVAAAADLHRPRLVLAVTPDFPGLLVAATAATLVLHGLGGPALPFAPLVLAGLVLAHTLVLAGTLLLRRTGRVGQRVVVVGTDREARRLGATLFADPGLGLRPVGFVAAADRLDPAEGRGLPGPLLGPVTALARALTETRAEAVVLAADGAAALEGLLASRTPVYAVGRAAHRGHVRRPPERVAGIPLVRLERRPAWWPVRALRRATEVVLAVVALAVLLPVTVPLGLVVKLETGGVLVATDAGVRFRTRRARSVGRPGPVGRALRRSHAEVLPEAVAAWARRLRYAGGAAPLPSAGAALPHQPQVDAGQLAS
jgi:hypothetical protein